MFAMPDKQWFAPLVKGLRQYCANFHGKLSVAGLLIGLCYLPAWLVGLCDRGPQSMGGFTLATYFIGLAAYFGWRHRKAIMALTATEEDRLFGHLLILCSLILFPFCRFALWPQSILWGTALVGIALSSWGIRFFREHSILALTTLLSVYPQPAITARLIWELFTPRAFLEKLMAQAGAWGLQSLGLPASVDQTLVVFPTGAVDVRWGCNGFDMALSMIVAGLIMGMILKQNRWRMSSFIVLGVMLALGFNIVRIMLMALASVYWGEKWFDFWHGLWGGQIFSTLLLTVYYYSVMAIAQPSTPRKMIIH
jgi:exosortase